jgi:sigma-B regulation protein RsbU (phosphoserine phosphatase)
VVVVSDGVSEALNAAGEEFGDDRMLEAAHQAARDAGEVTSPALVESIVSAVRAFTKEAPQSDDITAMVIRYLGTEA